MGWLRKVGRKIGKRLNKIFGSKLGPVVGAIGLYMLMGPVAKTLTGWASSAFGGGAAAAGSASAQLATTATAEAAAASTIASTTATAGTALTEAQILAGATPATLAAGTSQGISLGSTLSTAGAEIAATTGQAAVGAEAALAEQALLAGENASLLAGSGSSVIPQTAAQQATSASSLTQAEQIANMTNNMDQANAAISAIDSASVTGSLNVSPTITDSLIQDAVPALEQNAAVVKANVAELTAGNIPTATVQKVPDSLFEEGLFDSGGNLVAEQGATFAQAASDPTKFAKLQEGATLGEKVGRFTSDPIGMTVKGVKNLYGDDFVGDTIQGVTTGAIMGALQEEPEDVGGYGRLPGAPAMEAAQGNLMQNVGVSAMAAAGLPRMPTFQELSQQTLYGTGSPNYLSQFYQPLATPRMG